MAKLIESIFTESTMKAEIEKELGEEVLACGQLRQGRPPSMVGMVTGTALIGFLKPRGARDLPKSFLLAVTEDRVVAIRGWALSDDEYGGDTGAYIKGVAASWPRGAVGVKGIAEEHGTVVASLVLPDGREVEVFDPAMDAEDDRAVLEMVAARGPLAASA